MASPLHAPSSSSASSSSALSSKSPNLSAEHPAPVPPAFAPSQSFHPPTGTLNRPAFQSRSSTILPELPYDTSHHKTSITIIWTLLAFDVFIIPLALFYALWFGTHPRLDPAYLFAITTGVFGLVSGAEWAYRGWSLWRRPELRPLGLNHDRHADDVRLGEGSPGVGHEDEETQRSEGAIPANNSASQARKKKRWYTGWYYKLDFFHFSYTIGYSIGLVMQTLCAKCLLFLTYQSSDRAHYRLLPLPTLPPPLRYSHRHIHHHLWPPFLYLCLLSSHKPPATVSNIFTTRSRQPRAFLCLASCPSTSNSTTRPTPSLDLYHP